MSERMNEWINQSMIEIYWMDELKRIIEWMYHSMTGIDCEREKEWVNKWINKSVNDKNRLNGLNK